MVIKKEGSRTVLEAAKQRIINAFSNGKKVYVSFSGGKDSITLLDLILKLAQQGKIDPSIMTVEFIDEEAIYDSIDKSVREWRNKVLLSGAKFTWFCLEIKHFSCFNLLEQDENFICWEKGQEDKWIRKPPPFAVREHPLHTNGRFTYQYFLEKHNADGIVMTGVRMAESLQRLKFMTYSFSSKKGLARGNMVWPLYDWKDSDVWRYLYEEHIDIPEIYLHLYQSGSKLRDLRVGLFFSVDTAKSLVKMNEYYPDLMDRVIRREPNAYLAALYWDSEMFRHSSKARRETEDKKDYKAEVYKMLRNHKKNFLTKGSLRNAQHIIQLLIKYGPIINETIYKKIYDCLIGGDPKQRTLRALITNINVQYSHAHNGSKSHGKKKQAKPGN